MGVFVAVGSGVFVGVGVLVAVGSGVFVGVGVFVAVGSGVFVGVGVFVAVGSGVFVGVGVLVAVGFGVFVGAATFMLDFASTTSFSSDKIRYASSVYFCCFLALRLYVLSSLSSTSFPLSLYRISYGVSSS